MTETQPLWDNESRDELGDDTIGTELHERGHANLGRLISDSQAAELRESYENDSLFRSRVVMQRHNFGEGEYRYFANPLPALVKNLREQLYVELAPIANRWQERMRVERRFPASLSAFSDQCAALGQSKPTPLILKYQTGGYNCLHQDLYGECVFPLQVVILLSDIDDFTGGEFMLTEQRPRMQSRGTVIPLKTGHGFAFAVNERPKAGSRGYYRVKHRHGVSTLLSGERLTLGIIFHDAA